MCKVLLFGGTAEGRELASFCADSGIPAVVSVFSDYGEEVLTPHPLLDIRRGALDKDGILALIREKDIALVIDATHPYAKNITANVREACLEAEVRLLRVRRKESGLEGDYCFSSVREAVSFLKDHPGNVFVTTGSHELSEFSLLPDFADRVYARVLPSSNVLATLEEMGLPGNRRIAMQGPFSEEMNEIQLKECRAKYLVTKESGNAGGYPEKIEAARKLGVKVLVIRRPEEASPGMSADEVKKELLRFKERTFILAGAGGGSVSLLTGEVKEEVLLADAVFGSPRMVGLAGKLGKESRDIYPEYRPERVLSVVAEHPDWKRVVILFSGDPGFSSGALPMLRELEKRGEKVRILPGISSISLFAARLCVPWDRAGLVTLHGRKGDLSFLERQDTKGYFILAGGEQGTARVLDELADSGRGDWKASVGENLSLPEERIRSGTVNGLCGYSYSSLSLIYLEKPAE